MTNDIPASEHAARRKWLAVLARATLPELERMVAALGELPSRELVRPAEIGMVMLRGRVGGTGNAFNLGEASVVRCAVRPEGGSLGVAYALGRDKRRAELAALVDAMLQDPRHHARMQQSFIAPLALAQAQARERTRRDVAGSRVEFFTMVRGEA